ncbi:MAG: class I SAM-dependent DNA methyltransferase [Atopobiaceae bacterium]|nr:class I SAM-dependent DNA methyltransferase [Atopobiaceae bacterium]
MAIDLTGISSVNEFYTDHYLSTYFEQSVKEAVQGWKAVAKDTDARTPYQNLRDTSTLYYRLFGEGGLRRSQDSSREMLDAYLNALGYPEAQPDQIPLPDGTLVPLMAEYRDADNRPRVWVIACQPKGEEDLLSTTPLSLAEEEDALTCGLSCEEALDVLLLDVAHPARFVILASPKELVLVDRNKWPEKRYLSFDMDEIFRRREESSFQAAATFLAYSSLCPQTGDILLDELDRESREHASEVSDSLRYALRECVELLGNEVIYDWTHNKGHSLDKDPIDAGELTIECLRYMYRMLFLLFMEARPDLGFAPTKSEAYLKAYSLESIRSIAESHRDDIDASGEDTDYIDRTLRIACELVYDGYPTDEQQYQSLLAAGSTNDVFIVPPLKAHIFDRERTPLIDGARLRDSVMLQIVDKMSYTHPAKGRSERVSYGTLGINQLGSVYEALLSYRGFIAQETLYEVKRAKDKFNELDVGYFVTEAELGQYTEDERVRYEKPNPRAGELRTYEKGHFIYRLAGREREQSASYYTPESLTQCLVKYALKELLQGKTADQILSLTICEPAMGSAAFLNEAINQLAEAYLAKKQEELGQSIPHDQRQLELQRVKMFIADRNVYGIDLNPIAVELGEVSLWLNTISQDGHVPWFGNQLHCGNSLIGARRQGYTEKDLSSKTKGIRWYDHEPERVGFETGCSKSHRVYHFLVGDPGMADYGDKVIKSLEPQAIADINRWRKGFTQPYRTDEVKSLRELSYVIDDLWKKQVEQQRELRRQTLDELHCFGHDEVARPNRTSIRQKDQVLAQFYRSEHARNAGPYARLKFAMDYWCSLWFWPIDKADLLPSRAEFLMDMSFILIGTVSGVVGVEEQTMQQIQLDLGEEFQTDKDRELRQMQLQFGLENEVDLDKLCNQFPRLAVVREISERQHFFHWELEFADVFEARGGFDLLLGNPPWIKLEWNEQAVLSDDDPRFAVKKLSADQTARQRGEALENPVAYDTYLSEYVKMTGQKSFLNAVQNYPLLKGQKANLYRCFLPQAWSFARDAGISAFIHPDGILADSKGMVFRKEMLARYRLHFQFENELGLFRGTNDHGRLRFSLNIYGSRADIPSFVSIWNLFHPSTIDECFSSTINGPVPGIRDEYGNWNTSGHPLRIIRVSIRELRTFAKLLGDSDWRGTRIPMIHAVQLIEVLESIALQSMTISDLGKNVSFSMCWNETNSRFFVRPRLTRIHVRDIPNGA